MVLYYFAKEPHLLEEALNDDLLRVAHWLHGNKLTLNLTKMKSMIVGSNRKLIGISSFSVSIFDTENGWESFCDRGPDCQHHEFANGTLGVMPNEFAFEF